MPVDLLRLNVSNCITNNLLRYKSITLPEVKFAILLNFRYFTGILQGYYVGFNQFTADFQNL